MKKYVFLIVLIPVVSFGQFRDDGLNQPKVKEGIVDQSSGFAFGFLNSENFQMRHSFSPPRSTSTRKNKKENSCSIFFCIDCNYFNF